jgi:hypothetical protein
MREFIARNGLIAQNDSIITGSLTVTGGITGSLFGTASYATTSTKTAASATFNNGGTGDASGTTFNGATAKTISYNTLGAVPTGRTITINGIGQDLSANRTYNVGTVTSVAALTLGTTGTDISSSVTNGNLAAVITLDVPTASATNRGALSSTDWSTFNGKQANLGYTAENVTNKATNFTTVNNTLYPSVQAVKTYADSLVAGLLDDRGSYNASVNTFPTTGGSGTAGAVLKGDFWYVSAGGTLGGQVVAIGDSFRALVDTPAQTSTNWSILEGNIGYVPYNSTNPSSYISRTALSSTATGLTYTNTTGVFSTTAGYAIPTTAKQGQWDTAYGWGNHAGLYSLLAHTHTFASLTSKPTTLGGYGITDSFKSLRNTANLGTISEAGIYRQEHPTSLYNYTTTLNMNSSDGRQQLTIERGGAGMKFRGSTSGGTVDNFSAWKTVWDNNNLTNPITGSLTTGYIPKATGANSLGNSSIFDNGTNVLIGTTTDAGEKLQVNGSVKATSFKVVDVLTAGIISEISGELVNYGTNYNQLGSRDTTKAGGFFRIDTRVGLENEFFNVKFIPANGSEQTIFNLSTAGAATFASSVTATAFIKSGGTSAQFLMADGSTSTGGGSSTIIDDIKPAVIAGGTWYQPTEGILSVGIGTAWVEVGRNGYDGMDGADGAVFVSPLTTKGDLFVFGTGDNRLPLGTNNQVLTADNTQPLGLKWANASTTVIDDVAPTVTSGGFWFNPLSSNMHVGVGSAWVSIIGERGIDGTDGVNGTSVTAASGTGTVLSLTEIGGYYYNMASANSSTTYTTTGTTLGTFACVLINAATEPVVTGATKIKGSDFIANTNMHMWVQYFGVTKQYFFTEL